MQQETVIVLDFGGQYNQLIARRVRECNVYCEIYSYKTDLEKIKAMNPKGIILTGGPNSCYEADSPTYQKELFELGIPVLVRKSLSSGRNDGHDYHKSVATKNHNGLHRYGLRDYWSD